MVDTNSPTFRFFEKVGFVIGTVVKYAVGIAIVSLVGKKVLPTGVPGPPGPPGLPAPSGPPAF